MEQHRAVKVSSNWTSSVVTVINTPHTGREVSREESTVITMEIVIPEDLLLLGRVGHYMKETHSVSLFSLLSKPIAHL